MLLSPQAMQGLRTTDPISAAHRDQPSDPAFARPDEAAVSG